jgi:hypothetical protein
MIVMLRGFSPGASQNSPSNWANKSVGKIVSRSSRSKGRQSCSLILIVYLRQEFAREEGAGSIHKSASFHIHLIFETRN